MPKPLVKPAKLTTGKVPLNQVLGLKAWAGSDGTASDRPAARASNRQGQGPDPGLMA